MICKISNW